MSSFHWAREYNVVSERVLRITCFSLRANRHLLLGAKMTLVINERRESNTTALFSCHTKSDSFEMDKSPVAADIMEVTELLYISQIGKIAVDGGFPSSQDEDLSQIQC